MRKLLLGVVYLSCAALQGQAQTSTIELGMGAGASVYQGDIAPTRLGSTNRPGFSFQVFANYRLHPAFLLRGSYAYAYIRDNEEGYGGYHMHRNFAFQTSVNELSAQIIVLPFATKEQAKPVRLQPYAFAGAGLAFLSIKRDWSRFNHSFQWPRWVQPGLAQDSLAKMPSAALTFPIGLGLRYQFGENVALYAEGAHRITRNEYLDGFSKAANPNRNDAFTALTIGFIFRLGDSYSGPAGRGGYGCPVNIY